MRSDLSNLGAATAEIVQPRVVKAISLSPMDLHTPPIDALAKVPHPSVLTFRTSSEAHNHDGREDCG